jgi:membrane protein DedA with SNARE-associated domain
MAETSTLARIVEEGRPWLEQYGLLALGGGALLETMAFTGIVLPSTALLIAAGYLAADGVLPLLGVWLTVWGCGFAGAQGGYWLGYSLGHKLIGGKRKDLARRIQAALKRRGWTLLLWYQYAGLLDSLLPYAAGSARYPYGRWVLGTLLGTLGWSALLPGLGWLAHDALAAGNWLYWVLIAFGWAATLYIGWRVSRDVVHGAPDPDADAPAGGKRRGRLPAAG